MMKNTINNLGNGFVEMICEDTQDKKEIKVYFNQDVLEHLSKFDVEWKSWSINRKYKVEKFIGASIVNKDGKKTNIQLKRVIGEFLYGTEKRFTLLNSHHYDLRSANIFPYGGSNFYKEDVQKQMSVLKNNLVPLHSILTKNTTTPNTANIESDSIRVYEQDSKVIIIDLQKDDFILTIDKKYVIAAIKKMSPI